MTKLFDIGAILLSLLAGLLAFYSLAGNDTMSMGIQHFGGAYLIAFALPLVTLTVAVASLYGKAVHAHWWYLSVGAVGLVVGVGASAVAQIQMETWGLENVETTFAGFLLPTMYLAMLALGLIQLAMAKASRPASVAALHPAVAPPSPPVVVPASSQTPTASPDELRELATTLELFVDSDRYAKRWQPFLTANPASAPKGTLHVPSLVFGWSWWIYRKMYFYGFCILLAQLTIGAFVGYLIIGIVEIPDTNRLAQALALFMGDGLAVRLPTSLLADRAYLAHAKKKIKRLTDMTDPVNFPLRV